MERAKILIVGAGAIGQWLGSLLHERAQAEVVLLARSRQLEGLSRGIAYQGRSLPVEIGDRESTLRAFSEIPDNLQCDDIIFTVKAFQVAEAAAQVQVARVRSPRIWGFQNGLGTDEELSATFPDRWFGAMTTTVPVGFEDGQVSPGIKGGLAWATSHPTGQAPQWLRHMGMPCYAVARVDSLKISKLLLNLTCNASCALLDRLPAEVVAHHDMFGFELACLRELLQAAKALKIPLVDLPNYSVTKMAALNPLPNFLIRQILGSKIKKARGQKPPSLLLDLRAGRKQSEVDVLNGAVVTLGKRCGLPTPGNAWLHEQLGSVVAQQRPWEDFRGQIDTVARQAMAALSRK